MGVGDGVGLRSRPRSRSSSACAEFNSKNLVLRTSSRNSRLYARFKTVRRDEYVQKHCDLQDKKHENTVLSGEREAAASVVRAGMFVIMSKYCPAAKSSKGGDHALLQYVTVHVGIHGSLNKQ